MALFTGAFFVAQVSLIIVAKPFYAIFCTSCVPHHENPRIIVGKVVENFYAILRDFTELYKNIGEIRRNNMSSNIEIRRICAWCKQEFIAHKTTTTCCSHRCANLLYKQKKREASIRANNQVVEKVIKENAGVQRLVKDLNALYRENKALYECDDQAKGFQWMNEISANECYVSFVRKGEEAEELLLVVANFSGVPREITTGVPYEGKYKEILNTDAVCYGGTGVVNDRMKRAEDVEWDDKSTSVTVKLAPLSLSILQFIPYTEAELEKVIEKRIRKNTPIRKTTNKTAKKKQEK
jgi:hypothetical protein